jgi:hypothetical protein
MSHDIWDIRKSRKVELLFSLLQSVLFCCYNRTNAIDWVIYEGHTFIFPSSTRKSSFQVSSSGMELLAVSPMVEEKEGARGKSWNPQPPVL